MRVVADTNSVVSAFLWGGPPAQILGVAREKRISLFASAALIAELEVVLRREKFAARIASVASSADELVLGYRALVSIVRATAIAPISRDPDDDRVLACALAAEANFIVSGDGDLLSLGDFRGIRILTAREALAVIA